VVIVAILASFVAFLDGSIVNIALPAISRELGGGLVVQQWVVDMYLIMLGSLILIAGSLSDLFGRKKILLIGLVSFGLSSLLCAFAPTGLTLIIARALQGISGALLVPSSLALIITAFSGTAQAKAIGTWTAWTGTAMIIGPLLGGFLIDSLSWRAIFGINILPIAVTVWLLGLLDIPEHVRPNTRIDFVGAALCSLGLAGSVYALIEQGHYGWSDPRVAVTGIAGVAMLGFFIWHERRTKSPMLPLSLFASRNFNVGNVATTAVYAGLSVSGFLITIYVQQVGRYSALEAGMTMLPVTIIMFFLSSRFGALSGKFGPRFFMAIGPLLGATGFLLMLRVGTQVQYWTQLLPGVLVFGLGLAVTVAPLTAAIMGSIDSKQAGIGSAVNNAVARIAGLVAIAAIGVVTGPHLSMQGFHKGLVVVATLMALGGIISAVGIQNPKRQKSSPEILPT
jgi:EmrB/QacA subfamily drug resistance transporter